MTAGPAKGSTLEGEGDERNAREVVVDALSGRGVKELDGSLASEPSEVKMAPTLTIRKLRGLSVGMSQKVWMQSS